MKLLAVFTLILLANDAPLTQKPIIDDTQKPIKRPPSKYRIIEQQIVCGQLLLSDLSVGDCCLYIEEMRVVVQCLPNSSYQKKET